MTSVRAKPHDRPWRRLFPKIILARLLVSILFMAGESVPVAAAPADMSGPPVQVWFGSQLYEIPKSYLAGGTPYDPKRNYASFTISLLLPDFKPGGLDRAELDRTGWHNQLRALFEYGLHFVDPLQLGRTLLKSENIPEDKFSVTANGCKLYDVHKTFYFGNQLYLCPVPNGTLLAVCSTKRSVPSPSCKVAEMLSDKVSVIYTYSRAYVSSAIQIDTKIRDLTNSFRIQAK